MSDVPRLVVYGHGRQQQMLAGLPFPVTLLLGPPSVGKATLARSLIYDDDAGRRSGILEIPRLDSEHARDLTRFAFTAPLSTPRKYVLIHLDGASAQSCNQLLKTLEEPPEYMRFLLVASEPPLSTIMSRSIVVYCGLLTTPDVIAVLIRCGMDPESARRLAPLGGGTVAPALTAADGTQGKSRLSRALRALAARDAGQLAGALREWEAEAGALLATWAQEASSGRWRVFDESFGRGISQAQARRILGTLSRYPHASPRLLASSTLLPLCQR